MMLSSRWSHNSINLGCELFSRRFLSSYYLCYTSTFMVSWLTCCFLIILSSRWASLKPCLWMYFIRFFNILQWLYLAHCICSLSHHSYFLNFVKRIIVFRLSMYQLLYLSFNSIASSILLLKMLLIISRLNAFIL